MVIVSVGRQSLSAAHALADGLSGYVGVAQVIADIGAGTGQLARLFAHASAKVYAVEPDPAMRQVGAAALAGLPNVEFLAGCAEQTTCAENSIDLIVVGRPFLARRTAQWYVYTMSVEARIEGNSSGRPAIRRQYSAKRGSTSGLCASCQVRAKRNGNSGASAAPRDHSLAQSRLIGASPDQEQPFRKEHQ